MSSSVATTVGGVVVVTQVHPAPDTAAAASQQYVGIKKFKKGRPQVLGTIQIMVGILVLLLGISMAPFADSIGVYSGSFVWGSGLYIAAGSLTVAAGFRLTSCLVKSALIVSVIAAVAAAIITTIHVFDAILIVSCRYYGYPENRGMYSCTMYESRMRGASGILVVFNLLELIVAITVAGYACNTVCCCQDDPTRVLILPATALTSGATASGETAAMEQVQLLKSSGENEAMPSPPPYTSM